MLTEVEVMNIIVEFLAEDAGRDPGELYEELATEGDELPIDSLLAVDVLVRVQRATGTVLRPTEETAWAMRSVRRFAAEVLKQLVACGQVTA